MCVFESNIACLGLGRGAGGRGGGGRGRGAPRGGGGKPGGFKGGKNNLSKRIKTAIEIKC